MKWFKRERDISMNGIEALKEVRADAENDETLYARAQDLAARAQELNRQNHFQQAIERSIRRRRWRL